MQADWEVEVGGNAPVMDALWPGFIDLRCHPERISEISEAAAFPALATLLHALNAPGSPVWTAKCDLWEPEPSAEFDTCAVAGGEAQPELACYIDLLPREGHVFAQWRHAEAICREWIARLSRVVLPESTIDLVIREACAGQAEGFGVTAYISAGKGSGRSAAEALASALIALADAIAPGATSAAPASKLQWKCAGE